ncbi:MAG: adenosylcobinamide-GDP ribazoletransferase [Alphaproteobacteria bacterium]
MKTSEKPDVQARERESEPARSRGSVIAAVVFLTRLPIAGAYETRRISAAAWAFPLVGAAIGFASGAVYAVAAGVGVPPLAAALLALAANAYITGALHEDGLADTADALGAAGSHAQRLEIMRDSRLGAFGVLALIFVIGLKLAAISALGGETAGSAAVLAALTAAAAASRGGLPVVMRLAPLARTDGLAVDAGRPGWPGMGLAVSLGAVVAGGVLAGYGWIAVVLSLSVAALAAVGVVALAVRRLGGYTGDVLGATQQGAETAMLLALSAIIAGGGT